MQEIDDEFIRFFQKIGKSRGLDDLSSWLFARLFIEPGEVAMSALAKESGYSLAAVSTRIRLLEGTGFISRCTHPGTRKVFVRASKNTIRTFHWQLGQIRLTQTKPVINGLPPVVKRYEQQPPSKVRDEKLSIVRGLYDDMQTIDRLIAGLEHRLEREMHE